MTNLLDLVERLYELKEVFAGDDYVSGDAYFFNSLKNELDKKWKGKYKLGKNETKKMKNSIAWKADGSIGDRPVSISVAYVPGESGWLSAIVDIKGVGEIEVESKITGDARMDYKSMASSMVKKINDKI